MSIHTLTLRKELIAHYLATRVQIDINNIHQSWHFVHDIDDTEKRFLKISAELTFQN